ncbi:MAG: DUF4386 family protein [Anaerolineales bacterium]|nr:DUF4386 family protein [Anaerolineales bacterium]
METTNTEPTDPRWKLLYQLGGAAALSMVSIIVIQLIAFMTAPPPYNGTALDWFDLFQKNKLIGLIDFELLMVVYTILAIPLTLALYFALRGTDQALMALFFALSLVGTMCFIAARPAFEMLYLSNQFAAATTEAQKALSLAAGETKLATFHGTAFQVSYFLGSINGLIVSLVMLKSRIFSRATAYVRIASSVFDFGLLVPVIGIFLSIFSVLFLFAWNIMVARRLFQLARSSAS